jgi:hypothetical protein
MKLEEILPEVRKGRRFRLANCADANWIDKYWRLSLSELDNNDWELEPQIKSISLDDLKKAWNKEVLWLADADDSSTFNNFAKKLGFTI